MNSDPTTLYYFFSTVAQAHAAIVGLVGAFAAYRLKQLDDYGSTKKTSGVKGGTKGRFILFLLTNLTVISLSFAFLLASKSLAANKVSMIIAVSVLCAFILAALSATIYLGFLYIEIKWEAFWLWFKENVKEHSENWGKTRTVGYGCFLLGGYLMAVSLIVTSFLGVDGKTMMVLGMGLWVIGVIFSVLGRGGSEKQKEG